MKDVVLSLDEVVHGEFVSDIAEVDMNLVLDGLDIEEVSPLPGEHVVDEGHVGTQTNQADGQVAPDKSQAARDQDIGVFKGVCHVPPRLVEPCRVPKV